jgi:hypothetical protein
MSQVVPVQVDLAQPLQAGRAEVLVAALAPPGVDAVGLEHREGPRAFEGLERLPYLVAEHQHLVGLPAALRIESKPLEDRHQPRGADGNHARLAALGGGAAEHDAPGLPVDVAETQGEHGPMP